MSDAVVPVGASDAPVFDDMLPLEVIDRVWARLALVYGAAWLRMWDGLDLDKVKVDWRRRLSWVQSSKPIAFALDNLPTDWPPNALQFSSLCRSMPSPAVAALLPPSMPPEQVREKLASLMAVRGRIGAQSPDEWRAGMVRRLEAGEPMSYSLRSLVRGLASAHALRAPEPDLFTDRGAAGAA
jgi:hypothetical protein